MAKMKATLREIKIITFAERRRCIAVVRQEAVAAKELGWSQTASVLRAVATRLEHPEREDQ